MVRTEPIIAVKDVVLSSAFYQHLLGCKSSHGGTAFDILTSDNTVVLCLHKWGEHDHPTLLHPGRETGNGFILFFRVGQLEQVFQNALSTDGIQMEKGIHYNENSLKNQFIVRDPDGYYLIISE